MGMVVTASPLLWLFAHRVRSYRRTEGHGGEASNAPLGRAQGIYRGTEGYGGEASNAPLGRAQGALLQLD
jgi:hypothetical protein